MDDLARIGVEVDTRKVRSGKFDLKDFGEQGVRTESQVKRSSSGINKAFGSVGLSMKSVTAGAGAMFAALAVGFSASGAIREAQQFGSALSEVSTLIEGTAQQTSYLEAESKKLASTYGGTGTAQAKAFYQAISAGARSVEEAGKTLDSANKLAIGGVTDVTTAVGILSTAMNVYSASGLTAAEASDAIFVAVKAGVTTVGELSSALGKVLPLAEKMGLSFDQTAAAVAALTKGGLSTAEAVTGLRSALAAALGPTSQASDLAQELGLDFSAAGLEAKGFAGFMADVVDKTDGSAEKMQTLFGSVEAVGAALAFSGSAGESMNEILGDMAQKAGATAEAFGKMSGDKQQRLKVALGELWSVTTSLGSSLLSALVPALEAFATTAGFVAENADFLAVSIGLLATMQIPAAIAGLISLTGWLATSEGLFIAGAIAAKGMSLALSALPFVAIASGVTLLFRLKGAFDDARSSAATLTDQYGQLMSAQSQLDAVSVAYFNNVTEGSTRAMQAASEMARNQTAIALETAEQLLAQQERIDNLLGLGLLGVESPKTQAAREAVEALSNSLMDAESRLSAADAAVIRMQNSLIEAGGSSVMLVGEAGKLLESLNHQSEVQRAIATYGRDSAQVAALVAEEERRVFEAKLQTLDATEQAKNKLREAFLTLQDVTSAASLAAGNIGGAAGEAARLAQNLSAAASALAGVINATANMNVGAIGLEAQNRALEAGNSLIKARTEGLVAAKRAELSDAFGSGDAVVRAAAAAELEKYTEAVNRNSTAQAQNEKLVKAATAAIGGGSSGGGSSKAVKAAAKETKKLADEIERLEFDADPVKKYNSELDRLNELAANGLSDGAYRKAVDDLNEGFMNSYPEITRISDAMGDFVASGLRDFSSLKDAFVGMIKDMVRTAIANPIRLSLIGSVSGGGGLLGSLAGGSGGGGGILGGASGGGGLLGGLTSGLGALSSGIGAGLSMAFSGFASGGISGLTSVIGTQLGAATASIGAFGAALGTIALPLAAVGAVFSFFKKKTKELDAGLRITVDGMDTLVESFSKIETKRFWGLSKKVRTHYSTLAEEASAPIVSTIEDIASSVMDMGEVFGFASSNIDRASIQLKISTKGLSDEEIEKAITEEMERLGDVFADSIVGTFEGVVTTMQEYQTPLMKLLNISGPLREVTETVSVVNEEFEALKKEGEGSYDALSRLVNSIQMVNTVADTLGKELLEVTLQGADMASDLVDMAGGLEAFNSAATTYYQGFYSEAERQAKTTEQLTEVMNELGQSMPTTRAQFRFLVDAQDLTTQAGREMFSALVALAGQMDSVLPAIDSLAEKLGSLTASAIDAALGPINDQIEASNAAATAARQSATEFFRLADSLRSSAKSIGSISTLSDLANARSAFDRTYQKALSGDVGAMGDLGSAGAALATDSASFASSSFELKKIEAGIRNQLNAAAATAEAMGLGADYQAMLFDVQTAALEVIREGLAQGNITQDLLNEQIEVLHNLGQKIEDSANLQIAVGRTETGKTVAALLDGTGNIVGSLSEEGAKSISAIQSSSSGIKSQIVASLFSLSDTLVGALDSNRDGVISAQESQAASTLSTYQSLVSQLTTAINANGSMTTAQIRTSLAGKASDSAINSVISAVDRNKDGIISAEEAAASRTVSQLSGTTIQQIQALAQQSSLFTNAITGQTGQITNTQGLTNQELGKVQDLQGETVSITELVERAVNGSETLTAALLNRFSEGISVNGIGSMVSGLDRLSNLFTRIVEAQEAEMAAAEAEAQRQAALTKAQAELESIASAQSKAIAEVQNSSSAIIGLAQRYGVYLNAQSGPVQLSQTASFGVNDQGLFEGKYNQISYSGSSSKATNFKKDFYGDGGLYDQTYGRAAELKALAADLEARRALILELGGVPSYAVGTDNHAGGLAYVHKDEMINMPAGSSVSTVAQTRKMLENQELIDEIRAMREDMKRMNDEKQQIELENRRNLKVIAELQERNEAIGLPPVRSNQ